MIPPAHSQLASSIQLSLQSHAEAAEQISNPEKPVDLDSIIQIKRSKEAAEAAMAAMKQVNETAEHLLDIVV